MALPPGAKPATSVDPNQWYVIDNGKAYVVPAGTPGAISGKSFHKLSSGMGSPLDPVTGGAVTGFQNAVDAKAGAHLPGVFGSVGDAVQSVTDFFKLIGWLFHPRNILRASEFLVGITLVIFGFWAALQARGERLEGFTTSESALSRSGLGRVSRELAATGGRSERPRRIEAPHKTKRKAAARGREAAARGNPRRKQLRRPPSVTPK